MGNPYVRGKVAEERGMCVCVMCVCVCVFSTHPDLTFSLSLFLSFS